MKKESGRRGTPRRAACNRVPAAVALVAFLGCGAPDAEQRHMPFAYPYDELPLPEAFSSTDLDGDLERILRDSNGSTHLILWLTYEAAARFITLHSLDSLRNLLASRDVGTEGTPAKRCYLLRKGVVVGAQETPHDLIIEVSESDGCLYSALVVGTPVSEARAGMTMHVVGLDTAYRQGSAPHQAIEEFRAGARETAGTEDDPVIKFVAVRASVTQTNWRSPYERFTFLVQIEGHSTTAAGVRYERVSNYAVGSRLQGTEEILPIGVVSCPPSDTLYDFASIASTIESR